jgi:hypothetical protein
MPIHKKKRPCTPQKSQRLTFTTDEATITVSKAFFMQLMNSTEQSEQFARTTLNNTPIRDVFKNEVRAVLGTFEFPTIDNISRVELFDDYENAFLIEYTAQMKKVREAIAIAEWYQRESYSGPEEMEFPRISLED